MNRSGLCSPTRAVNRLKRAAGTQLAQFVGMAAWTAKGHSFVISSERRELCPRRILLHAGPISRRLMEATIPLILMLAGARAPAVATGLWVEMSWAEMLGIT